MIMWLSCGLGVGTHTHPGVHIFVCPCDVGGNHVTVIWPSIDGIGTCIRWHIPPFPGADVSWSGSAEICPNGSGSQVWRVRARLCIVVEITNIVVISQIHVQLVYWARPISLAQWKLWAQLQLPVSERNWFSLIVWYTVDFSRPATCSPRSVFRVLVALAPNIYQ